MKLKHLAVGVFVASTGCSSETKLAGTWNYDLPAADGTNVAQLACPSGFALALPQIGSITFADTGGRLTGTTDQGCSWTFASDGDSADLDPSEQTCFNQAIGSSYTLTRWHITVTGDRETEELAATSHQAAEDCTFALAAGRRTKVTDPDADRTGDFVGTWIYAPPDATGGNIDLVYCPGAQMPATIPETGALTITALGPNRLDAVGDDGCHRTLAVTGNTAELTPAPQTCASGRTLSFWSFATDGERAATVMAGVTNASGADCSFLLAAGKLARHQ